MSPTLTALGIAFAAFFLVFWAIGLLRPPAERLPIVRRGLLTDAGYWLFTPYVTQWTTRIAILALLAPLSLVVYGAVNGDLILHGFGPASRLPLWAQALAILVIGDFCGYWMHRSLHGRLLWRFHAVHHSSVDLDWLSSVRIHPVEDAMMRVAATMPVLITGLAPVAVVTVAPVLTVLAVVVHADVTWDWGPFRRVLISPRFHRWHHTDEHAARDKNFAGVLPLWDLLFGTYYMPKGQLPAVFGTQTPVPEGLWGQLWFPFRRHERTGETAPRLRG